MKTAILASTYFGPVQWYQKLNRHGRVLLEQHEHFLKQTYRNRCEIATTQGVQALTVPVEGGSKTVMKDIRISEHGKWRTEHWNALCSAYGESPFFEYYADDIRPFFERRWTFLFDFNLEITWKLCELLDLRPAIDLSPYYIKPLPEEPLAESGLADFREAIRPKHPMPDPTFLPRPYYQVYQRRHGFLPNLSILDLLFNMGNESILFL